MNGNFWTDLAKNALPYVLVIVLAGAVVWVWRDSVWRDKINNAPSVTTHPPIPVGPFIQQIDSLSGVLSEERIALERVIKAKESAVAFYEAELAKWRAAGVKETVAVRVAALDTTIKTFAWSTYGDSSVWMGDGYVDSLRLKYLFPPVDRWADIHIGIQQRIVPGTKVEVQVPVGVEINPPWWKEVIVVGSASAIGYGAATKNWKLTTIGVAGLTLRYTL